MKPETESFLKCGTTRLFIVGRVMLILIPHLLSSFPSDWRYISSLDFILVKPYLTLSHVREALAIQQFGGKSAYVSGSPIRLPPLLLAALAPLANWKHGELFLSFLCLLVDLLLAFMLERIGEYALFTNRVEDVDKEEKEQDKLPEPIQPNAHIFATSRKPAGVPLVSMQSLPLLAAQVYFYSPITVLSSFFYCYQNLPGFFLVACLYERLRVGGSPLLSTFLLAMASYLELHYAAFLVPLVFLPRDRPSALSLQVLTFAVFFISLQCLSYALVGPLDFWNMLGATYGLGWETATPNLSVIWYFAMQLFARFRGYFGSLLLGLPYIVVIPLAVRLNKYPMVLVAILSLLWNIFRPVETLFDANLSACFFLFCPKSLARMEIIAFFSLCSLSVPVILNVIDNWMWLEPNTGNANYMFFQCLAYNAFLGIILGQFCSASLQRDKALRIERETTTVGDR